MVTGVEIEMEIRRQDKLEMDWDKVALFISPPQALDTTNTPTSTFSAAA